MIYFRLYHFICLIGLLATSCASVATTVATPTPDVQEAAFWALVPADEFNQLVTLDVAIDEDKNHLQDDHSIKLGLSNHSTNAIVFNKNFDVQLWRYDLTQNNWVEVQNYVDYFVSEGGSISLPPPDDILSTSYFEVRPQAGITTPTTLRVSVTGVVIRADGQQVSQTVGAYCDFVLHPANK